MASWHPQYCVLVLGRMNELQSTSSRRRISPSPKYAVTFVFLAIGACGAPFFQPIENPERSWEGVPNEQRPSRSEKQPSSSASDAAARAAEEQERLKASILKLAVEEARVSASLNKLENERSQLRKASEETLGRLGGPRLVGQLKRARSDIKALNEQMTRAIGKGFLLQGNVTRTGKDHVVFFGVAIPEDGGFQSEGAMVLRKGAGVLLKPRPRDVQFGQMIYTKGVHFHGYIEGTNAFGGPVQARVYGHEPSKRVKRGVRKIRRRIGKLSRRQGRLQARLAPYLSELKRLQRLDAEIEQLEPEVRELARELKQKRQLLRRWWSW